MRGAIPPLPQYFFIARCLVKHRDNFIFTFYLSHSNPQALDMRRMTTFSGSMFINKEDEMGRECSRHGSDEKWI
jgi:hypothetical protein